MTHLELRPLALGEILDRTFFLYRQHFLLFVGITAVPHLLSVTAGLAQIFLSTPAALAKPSFSIQAVMLIVGLLVYLIAQGGATLAVSDIYLGRRASVADSLRRVLPELGTLFGVAALNGLVIGVAFLLLIVPGIYVACRLIVCVPAALVEDLGPRQSLSRSRVLTKSFAGRAFLIYLMFFVIAFGIGILVALPLFLFSARAAVDPAIMRLLLVGTQVLNAISNILVGPIFLIAVTIFYFDLRVRKEAFDLQFLMDPGSIRNTPGDGSMPSIIS